MMINRQIAELKRANYRELPVNRRRFINPFLLMSTTEALNKIAGSDTVLEATPDPKNPGSVLPIKYPPRTGLEPTAVTRKEKKGIPVGEAVLGNVKPTAIARPVKEAVGAVARPVKEAVKEAVGATLGGPLTRMANQNLAELSKDPFFKADDKRSGREGKLMPIDDTDTKGLAPLKTVAESENIDTHHDVSSRNQSGRNDPAVIPSISLPGTVGNQANLEQIFGADREGVTREIQDLTPEDKGDETAEPASEAGEEGIDDDVVRHATELMRKKEAETRRRKAGQQRRRKREAEDKLKEARAGIPGGGSARPKPDSHSTGRDALPKQEREKPISEGVPSATNPGERSGIGVTVKDGDRLYTQTRRRRLR